jgi:hypothetical protein
MTSTVEFITETLGPVTDLILGLKKRNGSSISPEEVRSWLEERVAAYTLLPGSGYGSGQSEDCLCIRIVEQENDRVAALAAELGLAFDQESVGLIHEGIYTRVIPRRGRRLDQLRLSRFKHYIDQGIPFEGLPPELQAWWRNRY